jgi:hypothetical protein
LVDEPSRPINTALQVKSYKFEKIASFRNIALFSSALSIVFQASYLIVISPVLLSYMSLQDAIFKTALILPVLGIVFGTIVNFVENFETRLDAGDGYRGSEAELTVRGFCYLTGVLVPIILAYCSYNIFVVEEPVSEQLEWLRTAGYLFAMPVFAYMLSRCLWQLAVVRHDAEQKGVITSRNLTNLVLFSVVGALVLGLFSGLMKSGIPCNITVGETVQEAHFILSVSDVTVFKLFDQVVIINSSQIEQMICGD